jgi:serine/threonine-protein kinase
MSDRLDSPDHALGQTLAASGDRVSLERSQLENMTAHALAERYATLSRIGEGGMGEVWLFRDLVIGRDVAIKAVRREMQADPVARARFLREARVQGQLEHPSIVPVYDLSKDEEDRVYFTMRHVRGRRLDEAAGTLTRHALLSALGRVCLAVDYAHVHGVVHRDLKPSNVMIGDYGEVYVLDWGVAKLPDVEDTAILGTPGYMAPEQVRGEKVDGRADVYALGACLFELLAGMPLHAGVTSKDLLDSTLAGADARASARAPGADIPVELEAICVRATATDPRERFASARAMHDAIEGFLEGDRDLERRRVKAEEHARLAKELAAKKHDDTSARAAAMREVGRALALAPENRDAMRTMVHLMTDPPRELPPAVVREVEEELAVRSRTARIYAIVAFLSVLPSDLLVLWMGARDLALLGAIVGATVLAVLLLALPPWFMPNGRGALVGLIGFVGLALGTRFAGPFVVTPLLALSLAAGLMLSPKHIPTSMVVGGASGSVLVPLALERFGLLAPSYTFGADRLCIAARLASFPELPTLIFLVLTNLLPLAAACVYLARIRDRLAHAERRVRVQAWQLRQIVPDEG